MVTNTTLQVWPIPAFDDNYIWCIHDGLSALVVDPGDALQVLSYLREKSLLLTGILITHHHADHTGGILQLLSAFGDLNIPVYGPASENIPGRTIPLLEGGAIDIAAPKISFEVLEVPGHTLGHIAYFAPLTYPNDLIDRPMLFCGDTLFASGCGRLFEGTPTQMHQSLQKFSKLPAETLVYCTHEYTLSNIRFALEVEPNNPDLLVWSKEAEALRFIGKPTVPTSIAQELRVNPFMRCDENSVRQAAEKASGQALKPGAHVLAVIRAWKDRF